MWIGSTPETRIVILALVRGPPISRSGLKCVLPLSTLPAHNYLKLMGLSKSDVAWCHGPFPQVHS